MLGSLRRFVASAACRIRPWIPWVVVMRLVSRLADRAARRPETLERARERMDELTGGSRTADEVLELARDHLWYERYFRELRWHPKHVIRQRVVGMEHLEEAHGRGRGVMLSFCHHAEYIGIFGSIARHGVPVKAVAGTEMLASDDPHSRQHIKVSGMGGGLIPSGGGSAAIVEELQGGGVVALALDIPGNSEIVMAGRRVKCSSGVARLAQRANAPIVVATSHRDDDGHHVRLCPPVEPSDFDTVEDLLAALGAEHAAAVLDWPAAQFIPNFTWTTAD